MAPIKENQMSDYELQRVKNMEENRRILESIRQEQVCRIHLYKHFIPPDLNSSSCRQIYKFEALQPAVVKKKERKPAEARPKKKPRLETEGPEGSVVDDGRRKSSRISGKVRFEISFTRLTILIKTIS